LVRRPGALQARNFNKFGTGTPAKAEQFYESGKDDPVATGFGFLTHWMDKIKRSMSSD
jgi:hypothetical protein